MVKVGIAKTKVILAVIASVVRTIVVVQRMVTATLSMAKLLLAWYVSMLRSVCGPLQRRGEPYRTPSRCLRLAGHGAWFVFPTRRTKHSNIQKIWSLDFTDHLF